jgi:hypothetical protein
MPKIYESNSMTKWSTHPKDLREEVNKTHRPIVISTDDYNNKDTNGFECKWCRRIIYTKFTNDSIWCNSCQSETIFTKDTKPIKKSIKAEVVDNSEIFVTSIQYNFNDMVRHVGQKPEPKGSFAELKKRGVRITSYEEKGGSGQPLTE